MVCAAAGCVGAERGDQGDSSQQPAEWDSHSGCPVLGFPLAGPAGNSGCTGLYTNSCHRRTGQVDVQRMKKSLEVVPKVSDLRLYLKFIRRTVPLTDSPYTSIY